MNPRVLLFAFVLAAAGCGPSRGDLAGKVRHRGRPVGYGTVVVIASDGLPYHADLQPDGTYAIAGVPTGVATVCVSSPPPPGARAVAPRPDDKRPQHVDAMRSERGEEPAPPADEDAVRNWQPIPERYADPAESKLQFTIKRGANPADIALD